jgi:hypothetical protein
MPVLGTLSDETFQKFLQDNPDQLQVEVTVQNRIGFAFPYDPEELTPEEIAQSDKMLEDYVQWRISKERS